jgi:hypothetical protein
MTSRTDIRTTHPASVRTHQSAPIAAPRPARLLAALACAVLLGGPPAAVRAAGTSLNVTASATGSEILNDGSLVAANHFGGVSDGKSASAPITLANGLTFGTSLTHLASGWDPVHSTATDVHGKVPLLTDATVYGQLMRRYFWIAYSASVSNLNIPGLTVGKSYRLQLISPNPVNCSVSLEGGTAVTWSGITPSLLTLTWTAADTTANVVLTRGTSGEIDFTGYALHDITTAAPPAPTNLAATPSNAQVGLTWTAASGATGYKVKRSTTDGSGYVEAGSPTATSFTDSPLTNGTTYYYVVTATNSTGESPNSGQVSATPTSVLSSAKDLLTFGFPTYGAATITGTNVSLTVPYGTVVTALAPTYTISPFATCVPASGSTRNFTNPVHYIVTAQDLTTKDYTVTVTVAAASSAKDMLTFGPGATISGTNIAWSMPYGTSLTNLAPTFTLSPLATCDKASGSTQNFSSPVHYIVTAQDNTTKDYTVTVTVALQGVTFTTTPLDVSTSATGAEILNTGTLIAANHVGNGGQIPITLANGLALGISTAHLVTGWAHNAGDTGVATITNPAYSNLINSRWWVAYTDSRSDMVINGLVIGNTYRLQLISVEPNSGTVAVEGSPEYTWSGNNTMLTATWTAEDTTLNMQYSRKQQSSPGGQGGEVRFNGYALHDITQPGSLKNFTSFTFPTYGAATIAASSVTITVPWGTDVTALAPTYTVSAGASGSPVSGTARNFTTAQTYTVTAQNLSTKDYTVTVNVTPISTAKDILTCDFGVLGAAEVASNSVVITVPIGTDMTNLAPTFTLSPFATISPVSGSSRNFTNPATYTVTAQDGSTKDYSVTVQSYGAWAHSASMFILTTPDGANLPGSAAETNFPLLVRLNSNNFNFAEAKPDGADLRFTIATGATVPYQIEQWDAAGGTASVWVKIPTITGNARQEIRMYWGKSDATAKSDSAAVFNATNGYASVIHLDDSLADELGTVTPVNVGTTPATGLIGKARHFVAGTGINCGNAITNYPYASNPFTSECWFRADAIGGNPLYWGRYATRYNGNTGDGNEVNIYIGSPASIGWASDGPGGATAATVPATGQWYHVAAVYANGISQIYVNGMLDGSRTGGATAMSIVQNVQMSIGGWRGGNYAFAGDIDEVRVSRVARSANWMKLQYENQKPLQTLVGPPVQSGNTFAVAPTSVTMLEGATTTLTAQAGGAQKIYWIRKQDGQDTVLAADQFTLGLAAGRITGNQSYVIQLKAIYPAETKTTDIPVTITEDLPNPVFTLTAPSSWDGRQTITVTPNISNLAAMQAKGVTSFNYAWNVAGLAVTRQITPGTLTLTRSQGSGPLTVSLVMDNGGTPVTATTTITVQEPASDAWVQRTPAAGEKPVNNQFFARDDTGFGTIYYNGTLSGSPASVYLKVYTTTTGTDIPYAGYSQPLTGGAYAFTAPIAAGLVKYKVVFGSTTGGVDTDLATVTNLVCGDAYLIDGQSNAVADNADNPYSSEWIRSYGNMTGGTASGWGNAVRGSNMGDAWRIGYWPMDLAVNLVATYNVPVCMINGAVGGTLVSQHQANPADHYSAGSSYAIYANILNRVAAAKLTHGIRAVLWHQGENNSGAAAPTGDWDYKSYQQYFMDMAAAWKQDYPNIKHYYVYQVWPLPCGMGPKGDQLREVQRTLPRLFSNMSIMSTIGVTESWNTRGLCHFDSAGYAQLAELMTPLVKQYSYGTMPAAVITAPDLRRAWFTSAAKTAIALEFNQDMAWTSANAANIYLDGLGGKVTAGNASGNVITLQLNAASNTTTITYLKDQDWNGTAGNLLRGSNNIAALTFADVTIESSSPYATWAANPALGLTAGVNDGPLDDPDHDGIPNLLEFTLNGAPMTASRAVLPDLTTPAAGTWVFEYDRNDLSLPPETTQIVEYGSDLTGWTPLTIPAASAGNVEITPGSPSDHVKVTLPDLGANGFVRLKVSQ